MVEIDRADEAYFTNLAAYDAYGEGNAEFQAGVNDAFPDPTYPSPPGDVGTSFIDAVRTDIVNNQFGALDPEFAFHFAGIHDSQFTRLDAFDGTQADIREGQGNIYSGVHVVSSALNGGNDPSPASINWSGIGPLAGVASYGLEGSKNAFLSNFQCDTVWIACIYLGESDSPSSDTPSVVTNVAQKCASALGNVWPTYYGVQLAPGISGAAVSNVTAKPKACGIANTQLVHYQGSIDPSVQTVSQSPAAQFCTPSLTYLANRWYTTPVATNNLTFSAALNTLYAIPVQIPCTVTINKLSLYVQSVGTATAWHLGIYANDAGGLPGTLIRDAGTVSVTSGGKQSVSSVNQQLPPGLVFLVAGCNGTLGLNAGSATMLGSILGLANETDTSTFIQATGWTYGALPSTFPAATTLPDGAAPLVYFSL